MSRFTPVLVAAVAVTSLVASTPAYGQASTGEISDLERRRGEITVELGQLDAELGLIDDNLERIDAEIDVREAAIELVADELERAVDARREPEHTRLTIALVGFTSGDPRSNALLDEVRVLEGDDEPSRRRELYEAVIEDARRQLELFDEQLRGLAEQMTATRTTLVTAQAEQKAAETLYDEAGAKRAELAIELDETERRLDLLLSLQGKVLLTGVITFDVVSRPVLAIKIDNVVAARPQAGINDADMIFVEEVEGGLTRLAAIFHSTTPAEVGPVRSMRTGDFDLLAQFNSPLFATSGGNRGSREALGNSTLVDIGAATHGNLFYRTGRSAPHNLFTNPSNLWSVGSGEDYETGSPSPILRFREPNDPILGDPRPANGVTINYGHTTVEYAWDGSGWARSQDNSPTVDTAGVRANPTTVIVQFTSYVSSAADLRSPEAVTLGQGQAWIFTDGQIVPAVWRRNELLDVFEYVDNSGNFITVLPGQSWIEMPRLDSATVN